MSEQAVRLIDNEETNTPIITTEIDSPSVKDDAPQWLYPLSINLWCKCTLSARNGDFPLYILINDALRVSARG